MTEGTIFPPAVTGACRVPDAVLCRDAWEVSSDGIVLIDSSGTIQGFDEKFENLAGSPVTRASVEALFPRGCRPAELLETGLRLAERNCILTPPVQCAMRARIEYIRTGSGLLTSIRFRGDSGSRPNGLAPREQQGQISWTDALLDAAEQVIVVLDRQGRLVRFNRAAQILTSFSEEDVLGQPFWEVLAFEDDIQSIRSAFDCFMSGAAAGWGEIRWKVKDGSARTLSPIAATARDCEGKIGYAILIAGDPTASRAETALASLSGEFMEAQSAERRYISRYLHDTVSQYLVVLALSLSKLQRAPAFPPAPDWNRAMELVDRCCRDLRVISYALAPPVFDDVGPVAAFEWYAGHLREDAKLDVEFRSDPIAADVAPEVRMLLFAAVQEWAGRAIRQPGRGKTAIALTGRGQELELVFECDQPDDESVPAVLASRIIRERIRALGGWCATRRDPGGVSANIRIAASGERLEPDAIRSGIA